MSSEKTRSGRKKITLECDMGPGRDVFVAGSFNGWHPKRKPMQPLDENGTYRAVLMLPRGTHEYKFVVDGQWCADTNNPNWVLNDCGTLNSVLSVE